MTGLGVYFIFFFYKLNLKVKTAPTLIISQFLWARNLDTV
jgi:hypothetical protein